MFGLSPKGGELNHLLLNLSMSDGLAGGAGGAGKKWSTIAEGWQTTKLSHPIIGRPNTQSLIIGTGKTT
jgi:hypothetical protein